MLSPDLPKSLSLGLSDDWNQNEHRNICKIKGPKQMKHVEDKKSHFSSITAIFLNWCQVRVSAHL